MSQRIVAMGTRCRLLTGLSDGLRSCPCKIICQLHDEEREAVANHENVVAARRRNEKIIKFAERYGGKATTVKELATRGS